jgi:hypothetical protein
LPACRSDGAEVERPRRLRHALLLPVGPACSSVCPGRSYLILGLLLFSDARFSSAVISTSHCIIPKIMMYVFTLFSIYSEMIHEVPCINALRVLFVQPMLQYPT